MVGFFAKYYIFLAGWPGYSWLVIVGILTSVISLYYYANIIKQMYFNRTETTLAKATFDSPLVITLVLTAVGTILFGIFPESVIKFANTAFEAFPF